MLCYHVPKTRNITAFIISYNRSIHSCFLIISFGYTDIQDLEPKGRHIFPGWQKEIFAGYKVKVVDEEPFLIFVL